MKRADLIRSLGESGCVLIRHALGEEFLDFAMPTA
jgi:hypothetical protein